MEPVIDPLLGAVVAVARGEVVRALRKRLNAPDERLARSREEVLWDFCVEFAQRLRDAEARLDRVQAEQARQRLQDEEALGVLANYLDQAYQEPINERRRMLQHAAAQIVNLRLSVAEHARVERILRELDPEDVLVLYALWLVPQLQPKDAPSLGNLTYQRWHETKADMLPAAGCVLISTGGGGAGRLPHQELTITESGRRVLRVVRTYVAMRRPQLDMPAHQTADHFRDEEAARAALHLVPVLCDAVLRSAGCRFDWSILYNAPPMPLEPGARGKLVVRKMALADLERLEKHVRRLPPTGLATPDDFVLHNVSNAEDEGFVEVQIEGPHDVTRFLAYDADAVWC